jgi:ribonuclease HI
MTRKYSAGFTFKLEVGKTWFVSDVSIRVENLPLCFKECMVQFFTTLTPEQLIKALNMLWCVWKARNEELFEGIGFNPLHVHRKATQMAMENALTSARPHMGEHNFQQTVDIPIGYELIIVDGSWEQTGRAGRGMVAYDADGSLQTIVCQPFQAQDPFHAEAEAVQRAIKWYQVRRLLAPSDGTVVVTDSQVILRAINSGDQEEIPSWRAVPTVMKIIQDIQDSNGTTVVLCVDRKGVQAAHRLANWARTRGEHREGMQCDDIMGPNFNITIFDPGIFKRMADTNHN